MQTLSFLLLFGIILCTKAEWKDPHSMDTNYKNKLPNLSSNVLSESLNECRTAIKNQCGSDLHLRRIIRLILTNAYLEEDMGHQEGYLNIKLSASEHQFLIDFSQSTEAEEDVFSEISSIFENALQKTSADRYEEIILSVQEKLYGLIFNPTSAALFGTCLALYITYKLLRAQFTWKSIGIYFSFLLYIADFVITYLHVIKEEEIDTMVVIKKLGTFPPECDPQKMNWWTYIKTHLESTFGENPCKAYYQATFQSYKYLVAPSKILTRQFRTLIVEPCGDIGEAFGKFGRGLFTTLPWGLNVVLFPLMLITAFIFIFILFLFMTKPHFKLSLFHLFSIELGQSARFEPQSAITNRNDRRAIQHATNSTRRRRNGNNGREVGFTENHRTLVEDVSNDNSSSHGSGQNDIQVENVSKQGQTAPKQTEKIDEDRETTDTECTSSSDSFIEL